MSITRRVRDLTVATLNDRLENAQDPLRVIDSFLREMADAIKETESLYRQCAAHTASVRSQYLQSDSLARRREEQAVLAVKAGEDGVARAALAEKALEEEKRDGYRTLYEQSQRSVDELEHRLAELKREYQEVYHKRQYYLARIETLRLQQRMHERTRSYASQGGAWFHRLEDRITDMELEARSLIEVRGGFADRTSQMLAYGEDKIEQALAQLKRKLEGGDGAS
jgi:phage shock protein A